jgi:hypothetical protein
VLCWGTISKILVSRAGVGQHKPEKRVRVREKEKERVREKEKKREWGGA